MKPCKNKDCRSYADHGNGCSDNYFNPDNCLIYQRLYPKLKIKNYALGFKDVDKFCEGHEPYQAAMSEIWFLMLKLNEIIDCINEAQNG